MFRHQVGAPSPGTAMAMWLYPAFTLFLGLTYLGPTSRLQSPAYTAAADIMPMRAWGVVFVLVALAKVTLILAGSYRGVLLAMCLGTALYASWAFLFLNSVISVPVTPYSAPGWPIAWALAHIAFLRTWARSR